MEDVHLSVPGINLSSGEIIGITIAVVGNVLISLALNLQKLAHKRLDFQKNLSLQFKPAGSVETEPLLQSPQGPPTLYGYISESTVNQGRLIPCGAKHTIREETRRLRVQSEPLAINVDILTPEISSRSKVISQDSGNTAEQHTETEYLKSKLWWFGFLLMNVGELGNFISYAWAPASVVAPLGTFALIANCFFAPLLLKERFRKRDLLGIVIAIIGAVTVVLASNASDTRLDPEALKNAICQLPFIIYSCIYTAGAIILSILSERPLGRQWVFIDVGLCALFGGFTVLSTKAVSTLLTMKWIDMFKQTITYPVILVLVFTGVGQVRYLNRALMRFDSKIVIPVQFVLFTLSAIIGAAILYGDFRKATFHQILTFLYGCAATFAGVFIIAWSAGPNETISDIADDPRPRHELTNRSESPPTLGRRRRANTLLDGSPALRSKQSAVSVLGLSSAQPLLLVHTPPREAPIRNLDRDSVYSPEGSSRLRSGGSSYIQ